MNHKISEWAMEDQEVAWDRVPVEMFIPVSLLHLLSIYLHVELTLEICLFRRQIFPLDYAQSPKHHKIPSRVV